MRLFLELVQAEQLLVQVRLFVKNSRNVKIYAVEPTDSPSFIWR